MLLLLIDTAWRHTFSWQVVMSVCQSVCSSNWNVSTTPGWPWCSDVPSWKQQALIFGHCFTIVPLILCFCSNLKLKPFLCVCVWEGGLCGCTIVCYWQVQGRLKSSAAESILWGEVSGRCGLLVSVWGFSICACSSSWESCVTGSKKISCFFLFLIFTSGDPSWA